MQFLWFYVQGPENGFELRHSIRSVVQNFAGEAKITVIGERPNWYSGHFIDCSRTYKKKRSNRDPFLDTQRKITVASRHPEIDDEFVWIMDDTYLLRSTTIEDLQVPRYDPWFRVRPGREWHRLIKATFDALKKQGKPNLQYGTHLPHHIEKRKLVELFEIYQYPKNLLLWEILYGNHYRTDPVPYGGGWNGVNYHPFLKRFLKRPRNISELDTAASVSHVLNYQSTVFSQQMMGWLSARFHARSENE